MRRADACASGLPAALAAAACAGAWGLDVGDIHNPGPGFMPLAAAAALSLVALGQLARALIVAAPPDAAARPFAASRWNMVLAVPGTLAGFGIALETAGFTLSTFVMKK